MKKSIFPIILFALAASCNMNSPEMIKQQIAKKKEQARKINDQIILLESQLESDSASVEDVFTIPVTLKRMDPESFEHYIEVTGKLEAEVDAFISPEMNGQIRSIRVKEGQYVKEGELLFSLNTTITESSIQEVKTGLELAAKLYEKQKELWDQNIGSEIQYLEAKNAMESAQARLATLQAQLDMARIHAPFAGVVETIMLKEGELAAPGMQVIQLVSLDRLKLYGNLSERYMTSIQKGDEVIVSFPDEEDLRLRVPAHRVGNVIDDKSRTFRIEMKIDNKGRNLKPNMFTTIQVNDFSSEDALVVPSVVIKQDIKGNYIYVASREDGQLLARKRYIETGLSYNDRTAITQGVKRGEEVIIKGFAQVSDGVGIVVR